MCDIIIRSLPPDGQTQLRVSNNGQLNQPRVREILIQFETFEKAMDQKHKDKDSQKKESPAKSGKNGKGSEKRCSNDGPSDSFHIPNKQRAEKICNRCKDYGGRHGTHNTRDCKHYKADETP